jgi:UDP-N-acetylglucosamine 1-carboxyvinyltransferase
MGCNIKWTGKRTVAIRGVKTLRDLNYKVMFDRIEAGTYMIASVLTRGNLKIINIKPKVIKTEIDILKKVGAIIKIKKTELRVIGKNKIKNIKLTTAPYPGFPTDLQAQLMVLLCKATGRSEIVEKIFENRFMHASELNRMGAKIKILENKAIVEGNVNFKAAELMATDLRASVSLILAGLTAKGKSLINRIYHLDRGYESIEQKLKSLGAKIKRIS